jgi:hypothetical protein
LLAFPTCEDPEDSRASFGASARSGTAGGTEKTHVPPQIHVYRLLTTAHCQASLFNKAADVACKKRRVSSDEIRLRSDAGGRLQVLSGQRRKVNRPSSNGKLKTTPRPCSRGKLHPKQSHKLDSDRKTPSSRAFRLLSIYETTTRPFCLLTTGKYESSSP